MSYQNTNRPIAAFSMADYESLTGRAEFGRGKDKAKRKKRGLLANVGIGAAGLAGAGAGIRYGGAQLSQNRRAGNIAKDSMTGIFAGLKGKDRSTFLKGAKESAVKAGYAGKGAKDVFERDINAVKSGASKLFGARSQAGQVRRDKIGQSVRNTTTNAAMLGRDLAGNVSERVSKLGTGGKVGLGLAGAAALGGAGYGAYKLLQSRKKKGNK